MLFFFAAFSKRCPLHLGLGLRVWFADRFPSYFRSTRLSRSQTDRGLTLIFCICWSFVFFYVVSSVGFRLLWVGSFKTGYVGYENQSHEKKVVSSF